MKRLICFVLSFFLMLGVFNTLTIAESTNSLGDVDNNGIVDTNDLLLSRKRIANIITNLDINRDHLDVNTDGKINAVDINYLRQHLVKKRLISPPDVTFISSLKNCLNLYGRGQYADDSRSILLSQTASGFEFKANCKGNLEINLITSIQGKLNVTVDNDFENSIVIDLNSNITRYEVPTDLPYGEHTFLIQKATEHSQNARYEITSIRFDGEPCEDKPEESDYRIEFYGDSITCGAGNLVENGSNAPPWQAQNGCKTYATFVAQTLGADYAVAAASAHGISGGYSNLTSKLSNYSEYALVDAKTPWDRSIYDADLIVINMGTNDHHRDGENLDEDVYLKACCNLVETMKTQNPDVEILWVIGMMAIPDEAPIISALKSLDEKYDYVRFHKLEAKQSGGNAHPTVEEHKYHAQKIVEKINEFYPDMFK